MSFALRPALHLLGALPLVGLLLPGQALALDVRTVHGPGGQAMFELRFHEPHEIPDLEWPATWSFSEGQKDRITASQHPAAITGWQLSANWRF